MYRTGTGVEKDMIKTYFWLTLAANQGMQRALHVRDVEIQSSVLALSGREIAQARKMVAEYYARHQKLEAAGK